MATALAMLIKFLSFCVLGSTVTFRPQVWSQSISLLLLFISVKPRLEPVGNSLTASHLIQCLWLDCIHVHYVVCKLPLHYVLRVQYTQIKSCPVPWHVCCLQVVVENTQISPSMFVLYLHENYFDFFAELEDIVSAMSSNIHEADH